jgi:tRNA 2-thiouridine synthesizing protein C
MTTRKILVIVRRPPYAGALAYESLEAVLVAGVFELQVAVVFIDDGVFQLLRGQNGVALGARNVGHGLRALDTYDVKALYVDEASLRARSLEVDDLEVRATPIDVAAIRAMIATHDVVLSA